MHEQKTASAEENSKLSFKRQLKTLWHRLFGKLLEALLTPVGIGVKVELPVMSDPPKADVLLLRRQGKRWTAAQRALLPDGVRDKPFYQFCAIKQYSPYRCNCDFCSIRLSLGHPPPWPRFSL